MRFTLAAILFISLAATSTRAAVHLMRDPLEGKWNITLSPDDDARHAGGRDMTDTLIFKGGLMATVELQKHGFEPCSYDTNTRPEGLGSFDAVQKSKTNEGTLKWMATIAATEMTGTVTWTKADGTALNFTLTGTRP